VNYFYYPIHDRFSRRAARAAPRSDRR